MWVCKHCTKSFSFNSVSEKANHSRWCDLNPKKSEYLDGLNKTRGKITSKSRDKARKSISKAHSRGAYKHIDRSITSKGRKHSAKTIELIRQKALQSNHRRLRKGIINYNGIILDSSWELALAKRLDELKIKWTRPGPLKWVDKDGNKHNYFSDFYLEEYNIYLDPKNPAAYENQKEKIKILQENYSNIKFIRTLKECVEFDILNMLL